MEDKEKVFSTLLINLLKGVIHKEESIKDWNSLIEQRYYVEEYFNKLGLILVIDDTDYYAYLKQNNELEDIPKLLSKRQLSYHTSLLLVMLRKRLQEFDSKESQFRLIITNNDIYDMMTIFYKNINNEVKMKNNIDSSIKKVIELGVLKPLKNKKDSYEVIRIIRSLIDAQCLKGIDDKLNEYYQQGVENGLI